MFDLSFYKLIKWVLYIIDDCKEGSHKNNTTRTLTYEMCKYCKFSILVLQLTLKENTNLSNIDRYIGDYFKYFMK